MRKGPVSDRAFLVGRAVSFYPVYDINHVIAKVATEAKVRLRNFTEIPSGAMINAQKSWKAQTAKMSGISKVRYPAITCGSQVTISGKIKRMAIATTCSATNGRMPL